MKILCFILLQLIFSSTITAMNIGLIVQPGYKGEVSFAYRIKSACKNLGWRADIINIDKTKQLKQNKYDCVISFAPGYYKLPRCMNYLAIFHPLHHYFKKNGYLYNGCRIFDGYLLTYTPGSYDGKKKDFSKEKNFPYMTWYPTVQKIEDRQTEPNFLFHIGCHWGNRLKDNKFKLCLSLLDEQPYMQLYGDKMFNDMYPRSYKGEIAYDESSLYETASQAGIALIFHSAEHNKYGLPSGRIFEAAAASTVIICDQNSFVQKNFGDSVLYINTDNDGLSIFHQIDEHMKWIKENKNQALEKAMKANSIYKKKFLLENQLLKFEKFHKRLMRRK